MKNIATTISYVFHPMFLPTAALVLVFGLDTYIAQTTPNQKKYFVILWIFVNTALMPVLFTLFLRWKKVVDSIQLHTRRDRLVPFAFTMFLYFTNYYLMKDVAMPQLLYSIFLGSSVTVGLAFVITLFAKISIHMMGMGGLTAVVFGMMRLFDLPLLGLLMGVIALSGLVGSARMVLKAHQLREIYAGWLVGFACVYLPVIWGWG